MVARVSPPSEIGLGVAVDEGARRVEEDEVEGLRQQVPIPMEQLLLEVFALGCEEGTDGAVHLVERDVLQAGTLHSPHPARSAEVATRRAEALEGEGEADALDIEAEAPTGGEPRDDLGQALLFPQPTEDKRWSPRTRGVRLETLGADLLDNAQLRAEAGEGAHQPIDRAVRNQLVAAAEGGEDALPDFGTFAKGLDDLEVLVSGLILDTTLSPDKHSSIIAKYGQTAT
jgi:hypothetical protein